MSRIDIGKKIQLAREEKKINQEQLATAIGCSQAALSNYEKGKRRIYLSQLEKLAEFLEKPLSYFAESFDENKVAPSVPNSKNSQILQIINNIYSLTDSEINEADAFIKYLMWKRKDEEGHGLFTE